jgi:hypothetical protein
LKVKLTSISQQLTENSKVRLANKKLILKKFNEIYQQAKKPG